MTAPTGREQSYSIVDGQPRWHITRITPPGRDLRTGQQFTTPTGRWQFAHATDPPFTLWARNANRTDSPLEPIDPATVTTIHRQGTTTPDLRQAADDY